MTGKKQKDDVRIVIAMPLASPFIYWKVVAGILEMERPFETDLMVFQGALVDRARNHLVEQMLNHPIDPTHLFFLDADIIPPADAMVKLVSRGFPIVSGLYRKRLPPHEPMAFVEKNRIFEPISLKGPALKKVDCVGGGCLMIEREVFEKIKAPWFTSEWRKDGHLSEDFSFCQKARLAKFPIYVDTSVKALHIEPMGVGTSAAGSVHFKSLD